LARNGEEKYQADETTNPKPVNINTGMEIAKTIILPAKLNSLYFEFFDFRR